MAAPDATDIRDFSGRWHLNRTLSDSLEPTFVLQGIPWIVRKVINYADLELQYAKLPAEPPSNAPRFSFKQTVRPGGFDTSNEYVLDGDTRKDTVPVFGEIQMHCNYVFQDQLSKEQTLGNVIESLEDGPTAILETTRSDNSGWTAVTVWGFEAIGGERHLCKYNRTSKGGELATAKMVYDYLGPPGP